jgi:hypothetical protein
MTLPHGTHLGGGETPKDMEISFSIEADLNNNGTYERLATMSNIKPNRYASGSKTPDSDSKAEYMKFSGQSSIFMNKRGQPEQSDPDWETFLDEVADGLQDWNTNPSFFINYTQQNLAHDNNKLVEHNYSDTKGHGEGEQFHCNPDNWEFKISNNNRHHFVNETQASDKQWSFACKTDKHYVLQIDAIAAATTVPIRLMLERGPDMPATTTPHGFISQLKVTQLEETQTFTFVSGSPSDDEIQIKTTANAQVTEIARAINTHNTLGSILSATAIGDNHEDYYNFSETLSGSGKEMPQVHICYGGARRLKVNNAQTGPGEYGNRCFISKTFATNPANIILFGGEHSSSTKTREFSSLDTTAATSRAYLRGGSKTKSLIGFSIFQRDDQFFVDSLMHTFNPDTIIGQTDESTTNNKTEFMTLESSDYYKTRLNQGSSVYSSFTTLDYQMKYRWEFGQIESSYHQYQGSSVRAQVVSQSTAGPPNNSPGSGATDADQFNYVTVPSSSAYRTNMSAGNFYDFSFEFNTNESDFYLHILEKGTENPISLIPVSNTLSGSGSTSKLDADITATSLLYQDDDNIPTIKKFIGCRNFATVSKNQSAKEIDFGTGVIGKDPMDVQPENYQKSSDGRHLRFPNVFTVWINNIKYSGSIDWVDATESDAYWNIDSSNLHKETETSVYLDSLKLYGFENGINRSVVDSISNFNMGLTQNKTKLPYRGWDDPEAFIFSSTNWIIGHNNKDLIGGTNYIPIHLFFNGFQVSDLASNIELNNNRFWAGYSGEIENLGQSWSPNIFNVPSTETSANFEQLFGIDCNGRVRFGYPPESGDYSPEFSIGYGTSQLNYDVEGFTQKGVVSVSYIEKSKSPRTKREHILASTSILKALDARRFTVLDATKFNIGDTVRIYKVSESAVDAEGYCRLVTSLTGGTPGGSAGDKVLFKDDTQVFNQSAIDKIITQADVSQDAGYQEVTLLISKMIDYNTVEAVVQTSSHGYPPTRSPVTGEGGLPRNYYTIEDWTGNYLDTTISSIGTDDGTNNNVITVSDDISGHITPQGDRYGNESLAGWKASITKYWLSVAYIPRSDDVDINRIYASMCGVPPETKTATLITDAEPQFGLPRIVTCADHGFSTDDKCVITDCDIDSINNKKHLVTKIDNDRFYLRNGLYGARASYKTASVANKSTSTMSVTAASHGYITGDKVNLNYGDDRFNEKDVTITVTGDAAATATITNIDNGELLSGGATIITIIAIGDGSYSETENVIATAHASVTTSDGSDSGTFAVGASGSDTMANIATFLNSHAKLSATSSGNVVTITQARKGTAGNTAITIVDPGTNGLSKTDFTGGTDSSAFTYTTSDAITTFPDIDTIAAPAATTITISAQPTDNSRLTIKGTNGDQIIFEFDRAGTQADGSDYSSNPNIIQVGAASVVGEAANTTYASRLAGCINNTSNTSYGFYGLAITASAASAGAFTLTQDVAGKNGNTFIIDNTGTASTATLTFYAGDVAEVGDTLTLISTDGTSLVYTWVAAADEDAATRKIHASNTATTQVDSLNSAIVHADNHYGKITCSQSGSGLVLTLTQVDKGAGGNTSVTVTGATTGQINPTDFTGGGTAGIVVANSNSFSGGRDNLSGQASKLLYGLSPATTGGDSATAATIYTMQPAFTALGGTVNEALYSDAYINNPHVLSFTNPENSIVNLGKDYGFGNYDDEKDTGGQAGQKIASSANTLYRINIDGVVNADSIEFNDTKSYLISTLNTMSKNVITIGTSNSATASYRPYAIFKLEDELPAAPEGFMVKPNKDNAFYPEFTWTTGDPDLWYGLLIISDKIINNQYHDAVIHYPLNETGIHGAVATPPTEKISGITTGISGALYDEEGLAGHCLNFDGTTNYVECNTAASSDPTSECTTEMSVVVHIVPDSASDQRYIVSQSHVNGKEKFHLRLNTSNQVEARVHFAAGANYIELTGSSILPANGEIPTNIILTVDTTLKSGNAKLFINGKLEDQTGVALAVGTGNNWQIGQNINGGNSALYIGNRPYSGDSGFDGKIEEVAVYKKCIYPVTPSDGKFLFTKPLSELVTAQTVAQSKSNTAKLFIKDYHNIRGETTADVTSTSLISWRKAAFALNTTNG